MYEKKTKIFTLIYIIIYKIHFLYFLNVKNYFQNLICSLSEVFQRNSLSKKPSIQKFESKFGK